jgi:hypothetical protein
MYRSRYLILQEGAFTLLYLLNFFIKIIFVFNQAIIEIEIQIKMIE